MANMMDYLDWRGDLTFSQTPFCDVDNLILSEIAYIDFGGIVPTSAEGGSISLKEAAESFFRIHTDEELKRDVTFVWEAPYLLRRTAESVRFGTARLSDYVDIRDDDAQMQFAAMHLRLGDGTTYVAFRGTDDTIVGWKEDFNMSFLSPVPAQHMAVSYLDSTVKYGLGKIRVGGHSKGGNLAIYSAVRCRSRVQRRIVDIYNNDGPGFDDGFIQQESYQKLLGRIKTIVPYHSVVGMLLKHEGDYMVVKSSQSGLMQHDPMSWCVCADRFETVAAVSKASSMLKKAVNNWISGLSNDKKEEFVDALFAIIQAGGARTLTDIKNNKLGSAGSALKLYATMDRQTRHMVRDILMVLTGEFDKIIYKKKEGVSDDT